MITQLNPREGVNCFPELMGALINGYITLAIAAVGIGLLYWAWLNLKNGLQTLRFRRVEGEILMARVEPSGTTIEFDHPTYQVHATVKYEVDGKSYTTSRIDDFVGTIESVGEPGVPPANSKVSVYYDPENPAEAVLDRAALRFAIILFVLALGFVALQWHWIAKTYF